MWLFLPWKFITRFDSLKTISFLNRWTWTRIIQFNEIIHYSLNRWPADKLHLTNLFVAAQIFPAFFMETNHVVNDTFCFIVQFFQTSFYYYFFKKSLIRWFQNFQFKAIDLMRLSFWCFSLFFFCVWFDLFGGFYCWFTFLSLFLLWI